MFSRHNSNKPTEQVLPDISVVKDSFVEWGVIPVFCKDHMLDLFTGHAAVLIK